MDFYDRFIKLCAEKGVKPSPMLESIGIQKTAATNWKARRTRPTACNLQKIADYFGVTVEYLRGEEDNKKTPSPNLTEDYTTFAVIGEVAAGYDHIAIEDWDGDTVDIPNSYLRGRRKDEFFVLRVKGDSMYPIYQDGDKVLVLRQSTLNHSGQVGVVIYDGNIGTLKKVEYVQGEDWMRLVPINPTYPPITIENCALEQCKVLGIPKLLIREIEQ